MEELTFEGKIEDIAVKPKKTGTGDFVKLKVNGKTFNFFDYGYYDKMRSNFKVGAEVSIVYMTNTFTADDGSERTSNTANAIAFDRIKDVKAFMPEKAIQKTVEVFKEDKVESPQDEDDIEWLMGEAVRIAWKITQNYKDEDGVPFFPPADVRTIADTMFMEACKRRK